jgi:tripartite-type tricarboxylate transporter receptor subunit TctC
VRDGFAKVGVEHKFLGGKDFREAIVADLERWKKVAKTANIVIND